MTTNQLEPIEMKLRRTNWRNFWFCTVCGGHTELVPVLCEASTGPDGPVLRVCEECLKSGNIDERLIQHALKHEGQAAYLRRLVGRLRTPTYAEWVAEMDVVDAEFNKALEEAEYIRAVTREAFADGMISPDEYDRIMGGPTAHAQSYDR
jgi:hypothetical protein